MFECREKSPHWPGLDSWWKFGCFWQFEQYTCKNGQAWNKREKVNKRKKQDLRNI